MLAHLESLPTEVQISILCDLDSIKTLFSMLRASPVILEVYHANRDFVFPNIVYNQITPFAMSAAVQALHLRNSGGTVNIPTFTTVAGHALDLQNLSMADWKHLLRHHCIICEMIHDSVQYTFSSVRPYLSSAGLSSLDTDLSASEYLRLVRAFYNLEFATLICSRYLREHFVTTASMTTSTLSRRREKLLRFECFLNALEIHEFEGIIFVVRYLRSRLYDFMGQAENDQVGRRRVAGFFNGCNGFDYHNASTWPTDMRAKQDIWLGDTVYKRSLAVIRCIVQNPNQSTGSRRRRLEAISPCCQRYWYRLQTELICRFRLTTSKWLTAFHRYDMQPDVGQINWYDPRFIDDVEHSNIGLLWVCHESGGDWPRSDSWKQMAIWGAVIWDAERLRNMGVLTDRPEDIGKAEGRELLQERRTMSMAFKQELKC